MADLKTLNLLWLDSPFFHEILQQLDEPEADKQRILAYQRDGYLLIDPKADEQAIDRIVNDPGMVYSGKEHETKRALNFWDKNADVRALAALPEVERILNMLYRRTPIPMQTVNFQVGSEKKAHSDAIQFSSYPAGFMCAVWIALEDITADNGPLELYPGSHKLPFYNLTDAGQFAGDAPSLYAYYEDYENFMEKVIGAHGLKPVQIELKKGQALVWAANMLHGGAKRRDQNATRYSQVTHYYFEDCIYYGPLFSDLPLGKLHYWNFRDIKTGNWVKHKYLGKEVELDPNILSRLQQSITGGHMKSYPMPG